MFKSLLQAYWVQRFAVKCNQWLPVSIHFWWRFSPWVKIDNNSNFLVFHYYNEAFKSIFSFILYFLISPIRHCDVTVLRPSRGFVSVFQKLFHNWFQLYVSSHFKFPHLFWNKCSYMINISKNLSFWSSFYFYSLIHALWFVFLSLPSNSFTALISL